MEITSVAAAVEGVRFAKDALKGLLDLKIDSAALGRVNDAMGRLADAQERLLDMRQAMFDMQTEIAALKQQIAEHDDWKAQRANYELVKAKGGAMVLASKAGEHHYACPACVNKREIHPLQDLQSEAGMWQCAGCKATYQVDVYPDAPPFVYDSRGIV
jgi:ribosomal protein L37AE/L43A